MTAIEAIQVVNAILKRDTTTGILTTKEQLALAKLVTIATERAFGKNRGSR